MRDARPLLPLRLLRRASRFGSDRRGVSGIEFALLAPVLLLILAGSVDLGYALTVSRKTTQIASTVADLLADDNEWTQDDVDDLLVASSFIMRPFEVSKLSIVLSVASIDAAGTAKICQSRAFQASPVARCASSPVTIPATIKAPGVDIVLAQVKYTLATPFSTFWTPLTGMKDYQFDRYFFARPRRSDTITIN